MSIRPLYQRIPEILLEEGPRAAAIAEEQTIDGWTPILHIKANLDPAITEYPASSFEEAARWMDEYYRVVADELRRELI